MKITLAQLNPVVGDVRGNLQKIAATLAAELGAGPEDVIAFGDMPNDLPLLERVSRPVAVDPDDVLRRMAGERGWPVISLRA